MSRVIHFEIHAENPERAINFYETLFEWEFTKYPGPEDYWLVTTGPDSQPGINGGLIRRRGVIVVPKMPIPQIGWLAYAKDTEGNIFGIMQSDAQAR